MAVNKSIGMGCKNKQGQGFSSSPLHPDWLWCPFSLLSNGYQGLFPWGKAAGV